MQIEKPQLEVSLSPSLLSLFDTRDKNVVIIDIFRATSTIVAALYNGARAVIPVDSITECIELGKQTENSITAGERDGKIADGLEHGNSPLEYPTSFVNEKILILTTTNGTRQLHMVQGAADILIGSFFNLDVLSRFLIQSNKPVLLGCSAWKNRFNLEDTLFAGAIATKLAPHFDIKCDSAIMAMHLWEQGKNDILGFLENSNHYRRLSSYGLIEDLRHCTELNTYPIIPILDAKGRLVPAE